MAGICRLVIHRGMEPLQALGLSAAAEAVYLDLLHNREASRADLEAALHELTELGLVERSEGGVVVRPPRLAMGAGGAPHQAGRARPGQRRPLLRAVEGRCGQAGLPRGASDVRRLASGAQLGAE